MEMKKKSDLVDLTIPRGAANEDPNFYIAVNGKAYLLPRGKTSRVPLFVKKEYDRAVKAQSKADDNIDRLLASSK